jgi:hypothetical protein
LIADYLKRKGGLPDTRLLAGEALLREVAAQLRMQGALFWKGYLFALNTDPDNWGTGALCAVSALKLLSSADASRVLALLRDKTKPESVYKNVRDDDWPPRALVNLYLRHSDMLAAKLASREAWKRGDMDALKQIARQNAFRQRQRLIEPRASALPKFPGKRNNSPRWMVRCALTTH